MAQTESPIMVGSKVSLRTCALACALAFTIPATASAQTTEESPSEAMEVRRFDIPQQPLPDALPLFSEQAGMQVSVRGDLVRDVATPGISGSMTPDDALRQLLAGTGLAYRITDEGAVILEQMEESGSGMMLDTILVETANSGDKFFGAADREASIYIGQQDLERRNPSTMRDVYEGESSVSVGGAIPASQKVYVQGVEETNLAVTLDGSSQNNTVFHHNGNNLIDTSLLKAARVEPGVASADAGPAALGGAIVYETVDVDDVLAPDRSIGGFTTGSFNTNGNVFTNGISAYGRAEGFEALGYFKHGHGNDYDAGNGDRVYGTETDFFSYLAKGAYESESGHRIELSAQETHDKADRPFRANIGQIPGRPEPLVREYNLKSKNYVLSYSMPDAEGLWDPEVLISYSESEIAVPEPYGSVGTTGGFSGKIENDFNFRGDNTLTVGSDFYDRTARYKDPSVDMEEKATNIGLYTQARLKVFEPLRLSFGGRVDHQWFEGVDGSNFENTGLSGNASLAYDVTDFLTLRAGYSNIWGGVAFAENFIMNQNWDYGDGIDPVRAENFTAGFEVAHEGFTFNAGLFRSYFDNARDPSWAGGPGITTDFNTKGYTVGAGYNWGAGFVRANYTDSEISISGQPASSDSSQYFGAPLGRIFDIEAAHSFEDIGVTVGGNMEFALKNKDTVEATGEALPAYQVVNLFTEYQPDFADFLTLRLDVKNLFDETYADRATYGQDFSTVIPLYEPGRSFILSTRLQF